jgi:hypothetical protein
MRFRTLFATAAVALALGTVGPVLAQAQDPLPDGPGKEVTVRICTSCHDATQFAYARLTPDEWDNEVTKMEGAGADMTAEEHAAIAAYLAKSFPKPAAAVPADAKGPGGR